LLTPEKRRRFLSCQGVVVPGKGREIKINTSGEREFLHKYLSCLSPLLTCGEGNRLILW
jgi:hypothetical protein